MIKLIKSLTQFNARSINRKSNVDELNHEDWQGWDAWVNIDRK
ncbi:hypothetical protein [Marinomonas posidonica]